MKLTLPVLSIALLSGLTGCINVQTKSSIDPIHITLDVNLKVQLQEELASVFGDIDAVSTTVAVNQSSDSTGNSSL